QSIEILLTDRDLSRRPNKSDIFINGNKIIEFITTLDDHTSPTDEVSSRTNGIAMIGKKLTKISSDIVLQTATSNPNILSKVMCLYKLSHTSNRIESSTGN